MKRLDLILNGKGGVGKSFFAVNFVQFLKDKGITLIAIDSDNENSTLKRFHPDTRFLDLNNRRELDGIFTALEKANLVVMDCVSIITRWRMRSSAFSFAARCQRSLVGPCLVSTMASSACCQVRVETPSS